jgi:SAM-dependent methyltransferase
MLRKTLEDYRGRHVGCVPGTHAALAHLIRRVLSPCAGVLDIGTHSGALLLRLQDAGFTDLLGVDLDPTRFDVPGAEFKRLELNQPFSLEFSRRFRLIVCTDVIEHLDSPRNFLTEARELLHDEGYLALSYPNVAFWEGRCKFLLKGELWGFGAKNYRLQRHISPLTFDQMELMLQEVGFQPVCLSTGGSFATKLRTLLTFPIWGPLRLIGGPSTLGESALVVAKKAAPDPDLKSPVHYRSRWQGIPDRIGYEPGARPVRSTGVASEC